MNMKIITIKTGYLEENCYILIKDNNCIIIDPGDDYEKILKEIDNYNLLAILITHNHFDHVGALTDILNNYNVEVFDKKSLLETKKEISNFSFEVLYNEGHSSDSISFYFEEINSIFVGDFIFKCSIGRCDLETGNILEMAKSLKKFINKFKNNKKLTIYPGHGEKTNLQEELTNNPYLKKY